MWFATTLWGIDPARVNLGVGYYSISGSSWRSISKMCPNVPVASNVCNGTVFVGKKMNWELGQLAQAQNLGGVFPWMMSYDAADPGNELLPYLVRGLNGEPMMGL